MMDGKAPSGTTKSCLTDATRDGRSKINRKYKLGIEVSGGPLCFYAFNVAGF